MKNKKTIIIISVLIVGLIISIIEYEVIKKRFIKPLLLSVYEKYFFHFILNDNFGELDNELKKKSQEISKIAATGNNIQIIKNRNFKLRKPVNPFYFEKLTHPRVIKLRDKYKLTALTAPGKNDFDKMIILRNFIYRKLRYTRQQALESKQNRIAGNDPLSLLDRSETDLFSCFSQSYGLLGCALALGYHARLIYLDRPKIKNPKLENKSAAPIIHKNYNLKYNPEYKKWGGGHVVLEYWSDFYGKWIVMDSTYNLHMMGDNGVPIDAVEAHNHLVKSGSGSVYVETGLKRIREKIYKRFHYLYYTITFIMEDAVYSRKFFENYGINRQPIYNSFIWFDDYFVYYKTIYSHPVSRKSEIYFDLNKVYLTFEKSGVNRLRVYFDTYTPNFDHFIIETNTQKTISKENTFDWKLTRGVNTIKVSAVNVANVVGTPAEVNLKIN